MYTNIPIPETIDIIKSNLELLNEPSDTINELTTLLINTLEQNYFCHNHNYYLQEDGLPMGSPLSSIISEIFLQELESLNIEQLKHKHNIIFYGRYVDDILIIYNNPADIGERILKDFNTIHPKIQFTLEKQNHNKSLNFLDLTITKHKAHRTYRIQFNIFRKDTTSKLGINYYSIHPLAHKWANYRFLLHRLNNIPLTKKNYKTELNTILDIAKFNNFPTNQVLKLNKSIKNRTTLSEHTTLGIVQPEPKTWASLNYYGETSEKIKSILQHNNINIAFRTNNNQKQKLMNKDRGTDRLSQSGIYELHCECNAKYIGRTTRKFSQRFNEHKHSFIHNYPERSNYAAHLLNSKHKFNLDNFKILKIIPNRKLIDTWEHFEIFKAFHNNKIINEQLPNINNPLFKTRLKL